jgi:protein-disulfide isomerase
MRLAAALVSAATLSLSASGASAARSAPAPARDWSKTVVATREGGFRMGNPAAKVKLVEYGSLACPHCRHFEETGYKPLVDKYVRTGHVSYEFRNLLLNTPDISASLLAHCAGAGKFFPMSVEVYATQPQWQDKLLRLTDAEKAEVEKLGNSEQIVRFADLAGFPQLAAHFGLTAAQTHQCLTDAKGLQRLLSVTEKAGNSGIDHTPTFIINGKVTDAALWEQLEPLLRKGGA